MYPDIPEYYRITPEDLLTNARIPVTIMENAGEVLSNYAFQMLLEIEQNNREGRKTVFILPCGPTAQYPIFARLVNRRRTSLRNVWFINMDELLTAGGEWIPEDDPQSFHRQMNEQLYDRIDPALVMPKEQRVFPDPRDPGAIGRLIDALGGVDMVMGGIALNGHLAFNEPEPEMSVEEFAALPTRVLELTAPTIVKNGILGLGGAYDVFPTRAITVGMKEMLGARRILVSMMLDMQRAAIRHALHGEVSASFPVTLLQNHPNAEIMISRNVSKMPF